jgi:hypothetical protein
MNWLLALIWCVAGAIGMLWLVSYCLGRTLRDDAQRLRLFRKLAGYYPETFEAALHHEHVMHPPERDTFPEIKFGVCPGCRLPWVLHGDRLMDHERIDDKGNALGPCSGSGKRPEEEF